MIDWLLHTKGGTFYRRARRLSKAAISSVFTGIRSGADDPSRNVFHHVQEKRGDALWSAICFFYRREPSFLALPEVHTRERICGFILLVEYKQHIAIFKAALDLPVAFRKLHLRSIGNERVEAATAGVSATFEQVRLRNMSGSKYTMRAKTLEADDLHSVISPSGSSRYVPSTFRTRDASIHYSVTPSTGRIASRSDRVGYLDLVDWATEVIDRLTDKTAAVSTFIKNFARPIDLSGMPSDLRPVAVAPDVAALNEALFGEVPTISLVRDEDGQAVALDRASVEAVLSALGNAFEVRRVRGEWRMRDPRDGCKVGVIRLGKTRIGLRLSDLPEAQDLEVEFLDAPASPRESLKRYLDHNDLFTVLFNEIDVVYMEGSLYRDPSIVEGGERLLGYLQPELALTTTTSEKGTFSPAHVGFDPDSVFGLLASSMSPQTEVLACDDLGDEWADFIGVNSVTRPKTVTFYHAKHGEPSLSASAFHVSVSQAVKNLQHLRLTTDTINTKRVKWESTYNNGGQETQIPRLTKGSFAQLQSRITETAGSPDTIFRVYIVTDSLSRQSVADTLAAARNGTRPPAHFVQLYSLLMGFFSACAEVSAYAAVICRP